MSTSATNSISLASLQGYFVNQLLGSAQTLQASGLSPLTLSASAMSVANLSSQFQTSLVSALESLFSAAQSLYNVAVPLQQTETGNYFTARTATSSNTSVVTATAADSATVAAYTFRVNQLAAAQINLGTSRTSTYDPNSSELTTGANNFTLTVGGTDYSGSVTVAATTTSLTVMNAFVTAINNLNAGVTARVVNSGSGASQTSQIEIVANETGSNYAFSLVDTGGGKIVQYTGTNTVQTAARDAQFYLNDVYYDTQGNTVALDSGRVIATLLGTSSSNVTLTVGADSDTITSAISDFVDEFNSFVTTLAANAPFLTPSLAAGLTRAVRQVQADLSSIGISVNSASGTLTLSSSTLSSALSDNFSKVKNTIGGFSGLATQIASQANSVISSPIGQFAASLPTFSSYASIAPFISRYGSTSTLSQLISGMLVNTQA